MTLKNYLEDQLNNKKHRLKTSNGIVENVSVVDLNCRWSLTYIRQELRRMGYVTKRSFDRWLIVYKKEVL